MPELRYTSVVSACFSVFHPPPAAPAAAAGAWLLAAVYVRGGAVSGCSSMVGQRRCDTDWTKFKDAAQSSSTPHMAGIELRPSPPCLLCKDCFLFLCINKHRPMHRISRTLHLRDLRARWVASLSTGSGCGVMCVPHIGWWWTGEAAFWFTQSSGAAAAAAGGLLWSHNRSITKESHVGCRGEWRHRLKS